MLHFLLSPYTKETGAGTTEKPKKTLATLCHCQHLQSYNNENFKYVLLFSQKDEPDAFKELGTGNRIATWLFYVSETFGKSAVAKNTIFFFLHILYFLNDFNAPSSLSISSR